MKDFYKGFIESDGKVAIEKFKNRKDFKTYEEVENLKSFAGVLNDEAVLIDIDSTEQFEKLLDIVDDLNIVCRVYQSEHGGHFLFKNKSGQVQNCKTKTKLACGLTADIKVGLKNSYEILKKNGKVRKIVYDRLENESYSELPKWLTPIKTSYDFLDMEEGEGRNQTLFNYILTLQSADFTQEEARECIRIINKYILKNPLSDNELNIVLRDEAFNKPSFFKGQTFLFDKFALYLKNTYHIKRINNQLHLYKNGIYIDGFENIEAEMIKLIPNLTRQKRTEVLSYLDVLIRENSPMSNANYIAFKNYVVNIDTGETMTFNPDLIITNKINYNYNPEVYSELADHTLDRIACGNREIRMLLEEVIGYCFYRRNELRKSFILVGDRANGKSTYLDMIKTVLGDENICALDLKELGDRFKTAELFNKLACLGDDIGDEFIANPSVFKKLSSGDRVNVERKGQNPFDFNNYAKLIFSANDIPRIKDKTGAVIDRLIIVPFEAKFSKNDADFDPYIKYKLREKTCVEYLINVGIEGLKRVLKNRDFTLNLKVYERLSEYEKNNNPILLFFDDITEDDIINEPTKAVYQKYNEFCLTNNLQPLSNIEFSKQIKRYFNLEIISKTINRKTYRIFIKKEDV